MDHINQLQFIGWLCCIASLRNEFFIFFHRSDKAFLVCPVNYPNDFYVLNETNIRHNATVEFQNQYYRIVLKGR